MPTLTYSSAENWMALAVWAAKHLKLWETDINKHVLVGEDKEPEWLMPVDEPNLPVCRAFFAEIAEEALERAFSLRAGDRVWGFKRLLKAIDPDDNYKFIVAFDQLDRESWLTPVGARKKGR